MFGLLTLRRAILSALAGIAGCWLLVASVAGAIGESASSSGEPLHGLTGQYFTPHLRADFPDYAGIAYDEFGIPWPLKPPDMVRIDSRIAFGREQGFVRGSDGRPQIWWSPEEATVVIWKGYVHLPKAGTYFFTTVSDDSSAVYLGASRVALNGWFGGAIPSDAFDYELPGADATYDAEQNSYVVPVTVDGPRDLPIEVRYRMYNIGGPGFGIDLYWVTPDSPRGPSGRPIAQIVPTDALFVEPPGDLPRPRTNAVRSTVEGNYLYFPLGTESHVELTIRVTDTAGAPLSGRRVHVSTVSTRGARDIIHQPAPTDENGVTTARVELPEDFVPHSSRFFATVLDDLVDISQVAEVVVAEASAISFLPAAFAPYYDGKTFKISPLPLLVGEPATITVPLTNRQDRPYELHLTAMSQESNIGLTEWHNLGRSETVVLNPGESREVSLTWRPERNAEHVCFKVVVWGAPVERGADAGSTFHVLRPARAAAEPMPLESRQQNTGPVGRIGDWLRDQIDRIYGGGIPIGPGKLDPATGRYGAEGPSFSATVGGREIASGGSEWSCGASEGADPRGDVADCRWSVKYDWFGGEEKKLSGRHAVRVSDPMQERLSGPMGSVGTKTGAQVRRTPGCDINFPEQC